MGFLAFVSIRKLCGDSADKHSGQLQQLEELRRLVGVWRGFGRIDGRFFHLAELNTFFSFLFLHFLSCFWYHVHVLVSRVGSTRFGGWCSSICFGNLFPVPLLALKIICDYWTYVVSFSRARERTWKDGRCPCPGQVTLPPIN